MQTIQRHGTGWFALALCTASVVSCAPAGPGTGAAAPAEVRTREPAQSADSLVVAGYGTLRQDEVTVSIRNGPVLVKVTPLDEAVIRLLAPDTYDRLSSLRRSRAEEAARLGLGEPEMFLVSFFSYEPDAAFQPEDLQIVYQSRLLRPVTIVPLTSGWGRQRLDQQETQTAIYAFDEQLDFEQTLTVRYGMEESDQWRRILVVLENERGRIRSRIR
jgi:hypothetical protein